MKRLLGIRIPKILYMTDMHFSCSYVVSGRVEDLASDTCPRRRFRDQSLLVIVRFTVN